MSETLLPQAIEPDAKENIWKERLNTSFPLNEMHAFLEGSNERALETLALSQQIERDPVFKVTPEYYQLTKDQHRELTAKKIARLSQLVKN